MRYTVIYLANREQIRDPELIYPGQVFATPALGDRRLARTACLSRSGDDAITASGMAASCCLAAHGARAAAPGRAAVPWSAAWWLLLVGLVFGCWLVWLGLIFTLFCLYFFRDPERVPPGRPGAVLAPADGRVVSVVPGRAAGRTGLGRRAALAGRHLPVGAGRARQPHAGRRHGDAHRLSPRRASSTPAWTRRATDNERNALAMRLPDGREIAVVQIAGLIARRIVCHVREGDAVRAGARFGIIRFGSRTDLYLPEGVRPLVAEGQTHDRRRDGDRRARAGDERAPRPAPVAGCRGGGCAACARARGRASRACRSTG